MDFVKATSIFLNVAFYGTFFPMVWSFHYRRHPPKDSGDELFRLSLVALSIVVAAVTLSGALAKSLGHQVAGGFFFYSLVLGAGLIMIAGAAAAGKKKVSKMRGLAKTRNIGLLTGLSFLAVLDYSVWFDFVPHF